jgi:predicted kinase
MVTTVREFREELNRFLTMSLAEIQEAIEKLTPEERAALREWLDEFDLDAMAVIRERVRQIRAGEATLIDGNQVQEEMRQLARQIANQ